MDPLEVDVRRHVADDAGIVPVIGQAEIGCVAVRNQCRAWRNVGLDEGMDMGSVVAWNSCEPDASRQGIEVLSSKSLWFLRLSGGVIDDLDGTDDDHLAGLGDLEEAVIGAERHLGLVDLDDAFQWFALRVHHRPPQFLRQQPSRAVGEPKLPLQLLRRHAVGVGGHQVSGPEPYCQRQLCPVHHRPSRHRCLSTAGDTLMGISSALQQAGPRPAAFGATKAIRPAALEQEPSATRFIRKAPLKFEERGLLLGHGVGL